MRNDHAEQAPPNLAPYFAGDKLYGDDFSPDEIAAWYRDEEEGYSSLGAGNRSTYDYAYHALNRYHGYRFYRDRIFAHALGLGAAYGDELLPIESQIERVTIVDPSDRFATDCKLKKPVTYAKATADGVLPVADQSVDLITCFGVLHHIPNVSFVLQEFHRVLGESGVVLIREPIVSMGDWTCPRPGLTKRERGIPRNLFRELTRQARFRIVRDSVCCFRPLSILHHRLFGTSPYNNVTVVAADAALSRIMAWNRRYHRVRPIEKIAPSSVFLTLEKR